MTEAELEQIKNSLERMSVENNQHLELLSSMLDAVSELAKLGQRQNQLAELLGQRFDRLIEVLPEVLGTAIAKLVAAKSS